MKRCFVALSLLLAACTDQVVDRPKPLAQVAVAPPEDADPAATETPAAPPTTSTAEPTPPACATALGTGITAVHGRLDGTVRAVVAPGDPVCRSDNDHVIVQIDAGGATYAAWVNVESNVATADPAVRFAEARAALPSGSWTPGWHPDGGDLDYASSLGVHNADFEAMTKTQLAARIASLVTAGAHVSVYFDGFATGDGGHKVHRNGYGHDGALVVHEASGAPRWLLFHFAQQAF